ncbi:hypothetical protein ACIBSV_19505 [Embleya sp. NPDC050154]|uniref:hypothetical protein n=1 Tax=unclassified Embleya TaxID=2699296 RepID=UPI00378F411E|nr:hypothetical protein OG948_19990 [Embleya sp. NBC_00888]
MDAVHEGLDAVRAELVGLDRPVVRLLEPGLPAEAVRTRVGAEVPAELVSWFGWADGTREEPDQLVDEASFIPGYVLVSLAEALEFREEVEMDQPEGVQWLPLLVSPAADFYAAVWDGADVQVASYVQGADEPMVYASIPLMLRTVTESFRTGAFEVDEEGYFDMHPELCDRVYEALNG